MSWPPTTMATQHPDNAGAPWWRDDPFIATHDEIDELVELFKELPIDEYMWDWEGKYVDESVGEKLYAKAADFFAQHPLGQDYHFTYRIPAHEDGKEHRWARAFMNILSLADLAHELKLPQPPVTEMFLPMVTKASEPMRVRESFRGIAQYHQAAFHEQGSDAHDHMLSHFAVTPLVEDTDSMFRIEEIIEPYWQSLLDEGLDLGERGQRLFLARSDPALNAGLVPAVLAIKVALSTADRLGQQLGFAVHPLLGTGSLPFRGSVNPLYTETFLEQYSGTRTYSIQSAFRYDYDRDEMTQALEHMKQEVPKRSVVPVADAERAKIMEVAQEFTQHWKQTIEAIAPNINLVAQYVPARRERKLHTGLFGYNRDVGSVTLPRAIKFTCALYSLGLPPELIATGRGLRAVQSAGQQDVLKQFYPALQADVQHAGKYFNRENLERLSKHDSAYEAILEDIAGIEAYFGIELGPEKPRHTLHRNLTSSIFQRLQAEDLHDKGEITADMVRAGVIRRSLG